MGQDHKQPNVVIYSDHLLPFSQTFVLQQGEALQHYQPHYLGSRQVQGLTIPSGRSFVVNPGSWWGKGMEFAHKTMSFSPTLRRQLKVLTPALLHAHFGPGGAILLPHAEALQLPLVVTFHGFDITVKDSVAQSSFYGHRIYLKRRHRLRTSGSYYIAVSNFIKDKLLAAGFPEEKILVHYIGVKQEEFQPDPAVNREEMVLFVGRLVEKKGCTYLIKAMTAVQQTHPNVELVIIGDGPLRETLEREAQQSLRHYRFLGAQPSPIVKEYMNRAKVFCVPSIIAESGDTEAFGIVFIEAQAMGLPVVSFASGGIPEAVAHQTSGYLAPEKDWQQLASYISQLLQDDAHWQQVSKAGRKNVAEHFDLTTQTALLEEYYRHVVNEFATK